MTSVADWFLAAARGAKAGGAGFHRSATWPGAVAEFNSGWDARPTQHAPPQLVNHPLIINPAKMLEFARRESEAGVVAIYSVLHEHPRSRRWQGRDSTWAALRDLQAMGHEIALHIDPYYLARRYGSLTDGIRAQLETHRRAGLNIHAASLAAPERAASGFPVRQFFAELAVAGGQDSPFARHRAGVSLGALADELGLDRWLDMRVSDVVPMFQVEAAASKLAVDSLMPRYRLFARSGHEIYEIVPVRVVLDSAARVSNLWLVTV